jgi:hypothetical protein
MTTKKSLPTAEQLAAYMKGMTIAQATAMWRVLVAKGTFV